MSGGRDADEVGLWFAQRLPAEWRITESAVDVDNDEILVVLDLPDPPAGASHSFGGGELAAVSWFRAQTRDERIALAAQAEAVFGRKVSWAVRSSDATVVFTTTSVPVMTRLRMAERRVLDTLIDAGVARSRSEALAWCVRLVGDNETEWIARLRAAFDSVEAVRAEGPSARRR